MLASANYTLAIINDGATGPEGPEGPQGPAGTPRMLGVQTLGLQMQLRGFLDDGTFGASSGYVYIDSRRLTISQVDYTVSSSATRGGFIIIDTTSTPRFVAIAPDGSGVTEWRDFNDSSMVMNPYAVIGEFHVADQAVVANMITPMLCDSFVKRYFMSLIADETSDSIENLNKWAEAVGVEKIFTAMAAFEAFINLLHVNHLDVTSGGLNFSVSPSGYQDTSGTKYALIRITDGNNNELLSLNGKDKRLILNPDGGVWKGDLDVRNSDDTMVLKTQKASTSGTVSSSPSGSLYSIAALKTGSGIVESASPSAASGTYSSKTISKACYRASSGKLQFGSLSQSINTNGLEYPNYRTWSSGALGTRLGAGKVKVTLTGSDAESAYFKRNGTTITGWTGSGVKNFEYAYSASDYYEIGVRKTADEYQIYRFEKVTYEVVDVIDGSAYWEQVSSSITSWTPIYHETGTLPDDAEIGTRKSIYYLYDERTETDYYDNSASITLSFESTDSYPAGFAFVNSDGSFSTIPYLSGYMDHDTNPITLNGWASSSNKPYLSGSDLIAGFSAFAIGLVSPVSPGSSSLTGFQPVGESNSPLSSVANVVNNGSSITFISAGGSRTVNAFGGNGTSVGVYNALAASVLRVTQPAGIIVESINRANANVSIGSSGAPFLAAHSQTFYGNLSGNVNSQGNHASYQVWGAVFN